MFSSRSCQRQTKRYYMECQPRGPTPTKFLYKILNLMFFDQRFQIHETAFLSHLLTEICKNRKLEYNNLSSQMNGLVKHFNKTLTDMLAT